MADRLVCQAFCPVDEHDLEAYPTEESQMVEVYYCFVGVQPFLFCERKNVYTS